MNKTKIAASALSTGSPTKFYLAGAALALALLAMPHIGHAQGIVRGAQEGAYEGNRAAGPVGAVVGGAVGGVIGGIQGVLGLNTYQASYSEPVTPERQYPVHPRKHHHKDTSR